MRNHAYLYGRMHLKHIDTFLLSVSILAPVFPTAIAKISVVILSALFVIRMISLGCVLSYFFEKLFIFILLVPGFLLAPLVSIENILVFIPIMILLFGFPFQGLRLSVYFLQYFILAVIIYLILGQVFIALGQEFFLGFQDSYYPIEINFWNYGYVTGVFYGYREFRAGGIFYNPNLFGLVLVLYFIVFVNLNVLARASKKTKIYRWPLLYILTSSCVLFSIYLTGSRTALVSIIIFIYLESVGPRVRLVNLLKKRLIIMHSIFFMGFVYFLINHIYSGFVGSSQSGSIKLNIFLNHILEAEAQTLFFGGEYSLPFDQEIGYWFGAVGMLGMVGLTFLFRMYYARIPMIQPVILSLLVAALGNSVFYGLLTGCIAMYVFIILSSMHPSKECEIRT
ncbi:hypothetical protein FZCC0069_05545 [Rhodobacterales bacterium FZCC0069]|nr:hypothetical protein [Rhodobacterales bacterium FZCC0069]